MKKKNEPTPKTARDLAHSARGDACEDAWPPGAHCTGCDELTKEIQDLADREFVKGYDQAKEEDAPPRGPVSNWLDD